MPKRFTDTEKWRDEWWGSLSNDYRMIWLYLLDSCSIAGIWKKDFRGLNFNCNSNITEDEFKEVFGSRVIDRGNFFFLIKFLRFQYPKTLNSEKPAIVSVRRELALHNLTLIVNQSFGNDYLIIKDKDKDTDKVKDKGKDTDKEKSNKSQISKMIFDDELWVEQLSMTHKGKNIHQAWEECYSHHSADPMSKKYELWQWRQKLNTWLTIKPSQGIIKPPKKLHELI